MKQKLYILLMAALLPVCAAAQGVDLNRGLVAYYPFEGNANDASGNGNNGRPEGATLAQGIVGQCYHFGGVDNSQIIRVPNSTSLQFSTAATFAFWFKLDDYMGMDGYGKKVNNGHMKFFAKDFDRGQICSGINGVGNGKFRVEISNNRNGCEATINGNPTSNWYHAVMVVTTSYFKIYINGEKVATKNLAMNFNESNSKDLIIGRLAQTWYPFHGCIDEFRVYNRELNDNEVSALSRGITGNGGTGELAVMEYRDYKFFDDEPDYKLYEDNLNVGFNGYAYCESTQKLYVLDGSNNIVEYDIANAMNGKVGKRTFHVSYAVEDVEVSPNGAYLAYIDVDGEALHIVSTSTGKEVATGTMGKKYYNLRDGKPSTHPFAFQSNNEVLVSGSANAMLFDIAKGKGKKLAFKKPYNEVRKLRVTSRGYISCMLPAPDYTRVTYVVSNGKMSGAIENMLVGEDVYHYYVAKYEYGGHGRKTTYYDNKTGNVLDEKLVGTDRAKYKYVRNENRGRWEVSEINNVVHFLYFPNPSNYLWLADYKMMCLFTKDNKVQIYNHTLTDNEMVKQQLLTAIDNKSVEAIDKFIADNPKSRYVEIARQKRLECAGDLWKTISAPYDYSVEHLAQVKSYIDTYGSQINVDVAKAEVDNIYKKALERIGNSDIEGFDNYIKNYPQSPYLSQARQRQREAYRAGYEELCRKTELQPYLDYTERYPNSPYLEDVKERARKIYQRQQAEEQRLKEEEEARRQEEMRQRNAAKLECVGKTIYWNEQVSFDISSGNEGLVGSLIGSALGTNKVTYNVRYYAIVEANLGQTAVKCVISNVEIQDPSYASVNYVKYKKGAYATLCEDIGKTRVKQLDEFEIR